VQHRLALRLSGQLSDRLRELRRLAVAKKVEDQAEALAVAIEEYRAVSSGSL
jgi:hypothetical protein